MATNLGKLLTLSGGLALSACATPSLTIKSAETATVSVISVDRPEAARTELGKTPLTIPLAKVSGKMLAIALASGKVQHWYIPDVRTRDTQIDIALAEDNQPAPTAGTPPVDGRARVNKANRLLLRATQALAASRWKEAAELAGEAAKLDDELAAPHIVIGLARLGDDARAEAKTSLLKAKSLPATRRVGSKTGHRPLP